MCQLQSYSAHTCPVPPSSHTRGCTQSLHATLCLVPVASHPGQVNTCPCQPAWGPVPDEGRALCGLLSLSGPDSKDTPPPPEQVELVPARAVGWRSPGLGHPELAQAKGLSLGTRPSWLGEHSSVGVEPWLCSLCFAHTQHMWACTGHSHTSGVDQSELSEAGSPGLGGKAPSPGACRTVQGPARGASSVGESS